jgi:hypothetical protein
VHQSNSVILGEKRIWNLSKSGTYAHSQSDARKSRDNKARSSLYAAPKKFSLSGLRANQAGAGFSLILKQDAVVVIASQRILRLLQRIHMVQFRPKRGLASAKNLPYKGKIFLSAPTSNTRTADVESSWCAVVTKVPSVSPSEELVTTWRHHLEPTIIPAQAFPESENDSSWERLALLSSIRPAVGNFYQDRVSWDEM